MKYHVNPRTGMTGACYAQPGKCPYGRDKDHYSSYEEAQTAAFELMANQYSVSDVFNEEIENEINNEDKDLLDSPVMNDYEHELYVLLNEQDEFDNRYSYLDSLEDNEIVDEITITDDTDFLDAVLSRRILVESDNDDDKYIIAAAKNPNIGDEWIEDTTKNPDSYSLRFMKALTENPRYKENELFDIAQNTKSYGLREKALSSPKISRESIVLNVGEKGELADNKLVWHFASNPNTPSEAKVQLLKLKYKDRYNMK